MRFKPGEKAEKERMAAINAQRQKADVWQREDLAEPGQVRSGQIPHQL